MSFREWCWREEVKRVNDRSEKTVQALDFELARRRFGLIQTKPSKAHWLSKHTSEAHPPGWDPF